MTNVIEYEYFRYRKNRRARNQEDEMVGYEEYMLKVLPVSLILMQALDNTNKRATNEI